MSPIKWKMLIFFLKQALLLFAYIVYGGKMRFYSLLQAH